MIGGALLDAIDFFLKRESANPLFDDEYTLLLKFGAGVDDESGFISS